MVPSLEQALVVVLGAAVAAVSSALRRWLLAKHMETLMSTAMSVVRAAGASPDVKVLDDEVIRALAAWLTRHGHATSADAVKQLLEAVAKQAQRDIAGRPKSPAA